MASQKKLIIILPPSEGKAPSGKSDTKFSANSGAFGKQLGKKRELVISALRDEGGGSAKLLGVTGAHLTRGQQANLSLRGAKTLPASKRYTGVVWDHLDLTSLPPATRKFADKNIVIVSGLLGLVLAGDPTPDYRLKIGASLAPIGKLSSWWRDEISLALNKYCVGATVINLLPQEHSAAFVADSEMITSYFHLDLATRAGKAGGHDAKAAKGRLARHLLINRTDAVKAIKSFKDPRFKVRILEQF